MEPGELEKGDEVLISNQRGIYSAILLKTPSPVKPRYPGWTRVPLGSVKCQVRETTFTYPNGRSRLKYTCDESVPYNKVTYINFSDRDAFLLSEEGDRN